MIVDAHHHVWKLDRGDYDFPAPGSPIHRDYGLADLDRVRGDTTSTVLVQTTETEAETEYMLEVASGSGGLVRGVVGWTDLAAADAAARIRALARRPALVGLRPMLQNLADPAWILRDDVAPSLAEIARAGLALDLLILAPQLPVVPRLAAAHPDLRLVIDHAAKPPIATGRFQPWADELAAAAFHPNVSCKLSGLVTEAAPNPTDDDLRPYTDHLIATFGAHRLLWGSDWPVVELAGGYRSWWSLTSGLLAHLPEADRTRILATNAVDFYRLPVL